MSKLSADSFIGLLKQSGLIEKDRLNRLLEDAAKASVDMDSTPALIDWLVAGEHLTSWQTDKLSQGKHKGFSLGKYRLRELLGKGGMSSVYLAEHVLMRRRCAIKVLPIRKVKDSSYLARFHREAQAVASLDHPNIIRAYDIDQESEGDREIHFLVMEYVKGRSIQDIVKDDGPLTLEDAASLFRQAALGLAHAHAAGLVHRDVKPGNLLVDEKGVLKLLDLGLALFQEIIEENPLTLLHDEKVLGTADYLSPEQALDSHNVDARADIYSLGCSIYFALTGYPPFREGSLAQRLMYHQSREPELASISRPELTEGGRGQEFHALLRRMMAKRPADRQQSMLEVADEIGRWLTNYASPDWLMRHKRDSDSESLIRPQSSTITTSRAAPPVVTTTTTRGDTIPESVRTPAPHDSGVSHDSRLETSLDSILGIEDSSPAIVPPVVVPPIAVPLASTRPAPLATVVAPPVPPTVPETRPMTDSFDDTHPPGTTRVSNDGGFTAFLEQASHPPSAPMNSAFDFTTPHFPAPAAPVPATAAVTPQRDDATVEYVPSTPAPAAAVVVADMARPAMPVTTTFPVPVVATPVAVLVPATAVVARPVAAVPVRSIVGATQNRAISDGAQVAAPVAAASALPSTRAITAQPVAVQAPVVPAFVPPPAAPVFATAPPAPVASPVFAAPVFAASAAQVAVPAAAPVIQQPAFALSSPAPELAWAAPQQAAPLFSDFGAPSFGTPSPQPAAAAAAGKTSAKPGKKPPVVLIAGVVVALLALAVGTFAIFGNKGTKPATPVSSSKDTTTPATGKNAASGSTTTTTPVVGKKEIGNQIKVGPNGDFATIGAALSYVKTNKEKYESFTRGVKVIIECVGGQTYSEAIAVDDSWPSGILVICKGVPHAKLVAPGGGPAVKVKDLEHFTLDGFEISGARDVGVELSGYLKRTELRNLTIRDCQQAGVLARGAAGLSEDVLKLDTLDVFPAGANAVGLKFTNGDTPTGRVRIARCRLLGPQKSGIELDGGANYIELRENIIEQAETGIRLSGGSCDWRDVLVANNTFRQTSKAGVSFSEMPSPVSHSLRFLKNLFTASGPEVLIDAGYDDKGFDKFISSNNGVEHNWSDRKEAAKPGMGERDVVAREEQRADVKFASSDRDSPDYLTLEPGQRVASIGGNNSATKPWVGARGPKK